jgi:AcrR family transcriptional regulator
MNTETINTTDLNNLFGDQPSKGTLKKFEIVQATIDCIATIGFEKTTYEAIAKKIGTRRAHIAYYFKDKQDIFKACIKYIVSNYHNVSQEHLSKASSPKDTLMKYVEGPYIWSKKYPQQLSSMLLFYYLCSVHDSYKELHDNVRTAGIDRIYDILAHDLKINLSKRETLILCKSIQNIMNGSHLSAETSSISTFKTAQTQSKKLVWKLVEPHL